MEHQDVIGRDEELGRVDRFLESSDPAALLIEGEAGIGKSTLWTYALDAAHERGRRVLSSRSSEAERDLAFGGLIGVFDRTELDGAIALLAEPRRQALQVALARIGPSAHPPEPGLARLAVADLLRALSAEQPVLVAVDDVQWCDPSSQDALAFAVRRLSTERVGFALARRIAPGLRPTPLAEAFSPDRMQRLVVGPLSVGAIGRIVSDRLGLSMPRLVAARLHGECRGNPFVALELARAVAARGRFPGPGEPLPVPSDVSSLLERRIAGLSAAAGDVLLAVSALARPTGDVLGRALGDDRSEQGLEELVATDLVRIDGSDIRCTHPLIASTAYSTAVPTRRSRMHRRLAEVAADAEERARHLALATSGSDEDVARAVEEAADIARRRGASGAAAQLAELAVSLTPPPDVKARARRETAFAEHLAGAGALKEALQAAGRALDLLQPGPDRVAVLELLGRVESYEMGNVQAGKRRLQQALQEAGGDQAALVRAHVALGLWAGELEDAGGESEGEHASAALELLAGHVDEDPESASTALTMLAEANFRKGLGLDLELLDRAVALEPKSTGRVGYASKQRAIGLGDAGKHNASIAALEACMADAVREGDWLSRPVLWWSLAWMARCTGRFNDGIQLIEEAARLAEDLGAQQGIVWAIGAEIHAAMGHASEARVWADRAVHSGSWWWEFRGHAALMFLSLTQGDVTAAAETLASVARIAAVGPSEPGMDRIQGDLVEAFLAAGRIDEATMCTELMERFAESGRHPWTVAVSARCRGLLNASSGRIDEAVACFELSLAADHAGEMAFERARTLLAMGAVLRRADRRRAAREALGQARDIFERCGSPPWAEQASRELAAVSGRAATPTELTAMERRVAGLAAGGKTNLEIARELYLSVRTVESHLSATYAKLGVRSRTELATALPKLTTQA